MFAAPFPPWRLPQAVPLQPGAVARAAPDGRVPRRSSRTTSRSFNIPAERPACRKGAMLTHRNMIANLEQVHAWVGAVTPIGKARSSSTALPLYHVFALTRELLHPGDARRRTICSSPIRATSRRFVKALQRTPFTVITGVNTLFNALLNDAGVRSGSTSRACILRSPAAWRCNGRSPSAGRRVTGKPLIEGLRTDRDVAGRDRSIR